MFYTYIIQSESTGKLYIGQTNNLEDRISRHNKGHNIATKKRGPWKLIYHKASNSRSEAVKLERKLKAFKNPKKVHVWIKNNPG